MVKIVVAGVVNKSQNTTPVIAKLNLLHFRVQFYCHIACCQQGSLKNETKQYFKAMTSNFRIELKALICFAITVLDLSVE